MNQNVYIFDRNGTNHCYIADPGVCVKCHDLVGETADTIESNVT